MAIGRQLLDPDGLSNRPSLHRGSKPATCSWQAWPAQLSNLDRAWMGAIETGTGYAPQTTHGRDPGSSASEPGSTGRGRLAVGQVDRAAWLDRGGAGRASATAVIDDQLDGDQPGPQRVDRQTPQFLRRQQSLAGLSPARTRYRANS